MKKLSLCIVIVSAIALVGTGWAEQDKEEPQLRVELGLVDGSHIIGALGIKSVPVQTSYGKMDVALKEILSIKMSDDHENATIDLRNGDTLKGVINLGPINLATLLGNVSAGMDAIREIRVVSFGVVLSGSWNTPMGGSHTVKGGEVKLSGPGDGDSQNAIAILDRAIPRTCRITGEMARTGAFSGFVIGYNPEAKTFLGVYGHAMTGTSWAFMHTGATRTDLRGAFALAFPPVDTYGKFTIDITPGTVTFEFGDSKVTMDIPTGVTGDRFGIETYHGSTMQVRNLVMEGE
jgi:hypothetical protein